MIITFALKGFDIITVNNWANGAEACNRKHQPDTISESFGTEKVCQKHLSCLRWPKGFRGSRCQHGEAHFHRARNLRHYKSCGYQTYLTAGTIFHKTRTPLTKWFCLIWLMGRQKNGFSILLLQEMLEIKSYKTLMWIMGHRICNALADQDAYYKLAGLIERDDTYFGTPKHGKRGQGAPGKAKVSLS